MIILALTLLATPLPLYPGAVAKKLPEMNKSGVTIYAASQTPKTVANWYAKKLKRPVRTVREPGFLSYNIVLKERKSAINGAQKNLLELGVVVWGEANGSCFIALVDRPILSTSLNAQGRAANLSFGPDAPIKKAKGADPNRYSKDALRGSSVEGRSVEGSFR
jgi:hypothetical protein